MDIEWGKLEDWFRYSKRPPIATPTVNKYRRMFIRVKPHFDTNGWNKESLLEFVKLKKKEGLKNKSINDYGKFFRHIDNYLGTNHADILQRLQEEDTYFDVITKEELQSILACEPAYSLKARTKVNKHTYTVLFMLLSEMALRIEEALAIKWDDWKGDYITIFASKTNRYDDVLISNQLQKELEELPRLQDRVFNLRRQSVSNELQRRCAVLGIKKQVTSHTFRRSFATIGIEEGIQDKFIQEKGRWKSANSMDKYIRKSKRHQKEVLRRHPFTVDRISVEEKFTYAKDKIAELEKEIDSLLLPEELRALLKI